MKKILLIVMLVFSTVIYGENSSPTITMSGTGQVEVVPDIAVISFGLENIGKDLAPLKKENDRTIKKVVDALLKAKISRSDLYTSNYTISHNYDYRTKTEPREKVYTVRNQLKLTVRDLDRVGELITLLEANGINTIQGITYTTTKKDELNLKALELAYLDAKEKALHIAKLEGYKVEVSSISSNSYAPRPELYMAADSRTKSNPIYTPDEISISTSITVIFKFVK